MVGYKQRDSYFDLVKALAIFLVVLGHCGASLHSMYLENFIVGCNMPLFFILSGWFAYDTIRNRDAKRLLRHLRSYLQPVLSTALVFAILSAVIGLIPWMSVGTYALKRVLFSAWFLWVLSIVYLICFSISLVVESFKWYCLASVAVFGTLLFIPNILSGILQIHSVRHMMPYFIVGQILRWYDFRPWKITRLGMTAFLLFAIFVVFEGDVRQNNMGFYWVESSWRGVLCGQINFISFIARNIVGVIGAVGVMWIVHELKYCLKHGCEVAFMGRYTICIYLLHFWFYERLLSCCSVLFTAFWSVVLVSVALTMFCSLTGWWTMEKVKFLRSILWGR